MKKPTLLFSLALFLMGATAFAQQSVAEQEHKPQMVRSVIEKQHKVPFSKVRASVEKADESLYSGRTVYVDLVNSNQWSGMSIGSVPYGIHSHAFGSGSNFTAITTGSLYEFFSATKARDMILGVRQMSIMGAFNGAHYMELDTVQFNASYSEMIGETGRYSLLPCAMTYDPTSDLVYAAMYNDELNGLNWATYDRTTHRFVIKSKWNNDFQPLVMGGTPDGRLMAISADGYLYELDKTNGDASMIGETGVTPTLYVQSMTYDARTAKFIWMSTENAGPRMYAVDPETGAAQLIESLSDNEQAAAIFFKTNEAPDAAPAAITDLDIEYASAGSTSGSITYTVPSKAYDGAALTKNVTLNVWLDGKNIVSNATVAPGSKQNHAVDLTEGNHYVYVLLKNDGGFSPVNELFEYAGYDTPVAVENVTLSVTDGKSTLTWDKPAGGVNGGYIDYDNTLSYTIVRMPDSVTVATNLKANTFEETLPSTLQRYYYQVYACNGDNHMSEPALSNAVLSGNAYTVPYYENFESEEIVSLFTIIDGNNDTYTWTYNSWNQCMTMNTISWGIETGSNDWLVTPGIALEKGISYDLTYMLRNTFKNYPERFAILMGTSPTDTANMKTIATYDPFDCGGVETAISHDIIVDESGTYYFAVKCYSQKADNCSGMFINSISIEANGKVGAPASVSDIVITPEPEGELSADITVTLPTENLNGEPLSGTVDVYIYRDGSEEPVGTLTGQTPGARVTWKDTSVPDAGFHVYTIVCANGEGNGKSASAREFIGVFTTPWTETFDTESSREFFSVQTNAPEGGNPCDWTWSSYDQQLSFTYFVNSPIHAWLFTPALKLDADMVYEYSFNWKNSVYGAGGTTYYATFGDAPDSLAQNKIQLLPTTSWNGTRVTTEFITTKSGKHYPGIFIDESTANFYIMAYVDSMVVRRVASAFAPNAVQNLTVIPDQKGALSVDFSFDAPTTDYAGRDLNGNMSIEILRGNSSIPLTTLTDVEPGKAITWTDSQPLNGYNTYIVVASNDYGRGKVSTDTVYVGIDIPNPVDDFSIVGTADNSGAVINWTAPTEGVNGGVIGDNVSYIIAEYFPEETDTTKMLSVLGSTYNTTYTVEANETGDQTIHYYVVYTYNEAGLGKAVVGYIVLGKPYDLPFTETFNNGAASTSIWIGGGDYTSYGAWANAQDDSKYTAQDGDNGFMRYYNGSYYDMPLWGYLVTPKFKGSNAKQLTVKFWTLGAAGTYASKPKLYVSASHNDGDMEIVGDTITIDGSQTEWQSHSLTFSAASDANYYNVMFSALCSGYNDLVLLDNIEIAVSSAGVVESVATDGGVVRPVKAGISVRGFAGKDAEVFDVAGVLVDRFTCDGNMIRNAKAGIYVVRIADKSFKIRVN